MANSASSLRRSRADPTASSSSRCGYRHRHGYIAPPVSAERQASTSRRIRCSGAIVEVQLFLARRAGRGRPHSAQVDRAYLGKHADDTGHFGSLVAEDDPAIFPPHAAAELAAAASGMKRSTGPFVSSVIEEVGCWRAARQHPRCSWCSAIRPAWAWSAPTVTPRSRTCSTIHDVQNAPET